MALRVVEAAEGTTAARQAEAVLLAAKMAAADVVGASEEMVG